MSALARAHGLSELTPQWSQPVWWFGQVWVGGEFATMMLDGKRRAIHDLLAGTVVVSQVDAPYPGVSIR